MPSNLIPRPGGVAARVTLGGKQTWLGTFPTSEAAQDAVRAAREKHRASPARRKKRPVRRRPPAPEVCAQIAAELPTTLEVFALVALWSGLRLSEVADLEPRDVDFRIDGTAVLHVRHGKGDKEGWSLLYPVGADALRAHMTRCPSCRLPQVLLNSEGRPWDRKSVNKAWVKARAKVAGCEAVTFHTLRKAHATWLLDQGASDLDVAIQLRHIDWQGRPDPSLVRAVYGFPTVDAALERLAAVGR